MDIELLRRFHESKPTAKVDCIENLEDGGRVRVYWYTENDGGHMDLYLFN